MRKGLTAGDTAELTWRVGPEHVIHLGADQADDGVVVFATPSMVNLMEHAARETLRPFLEPGEESVGVNVTVEHVAATPLAADVRAQARVTAVDRGTVDFAIIAHDAIEEIGRGTHRRAVVRTERLAKRVAEKSASLPEATMSTTMIQADQGPLRPLDLIEVEVDGPVVLVTLNRPKQLNAVNMQMTADWERLIAWLAGHGDEFRVVIVTGAGRAFCAGDDVKELGDLDIPTATALSHRQAQVYLALEQLPQMIIAAVNGEAFGAGCVAAYSCDLRIAAAPAMFGMPEILLGWAPGYGIAQLTALVGKARAIELCTTGRQINAREAEAWGLVNKVVPGNRLMAEARALADQLLKMPPRALRETKRLIHADEGVRPKTTYLADTAAYIRCLDTADAREGIAAFREKRLPKFTGD